MSQIADRIKSRIENRSLILVGLMGSGKTTTGKNISRILKLRFYDSDHEIETISQMTIADFFSVYGEQKFRALEQQIISRLLIKEGPIVLATGGGAYMNAETRRTISKYGLSIWLKADIDLLLERVSLNNNRPLLQTTNPHAVMQQLMHERYPVYAEADIIVQIRKIHQNAIIRDIIRKIDHHLTLQKESVLHEC